MSAAKKRGSYAVKKRRKGGSRRQSIEAGKLADPKHPPSKTKRKR